MNKSNIHQHLMNLGFDRFYWDFDSYNTFIDRLIDTNSNNPNIPMSLLIQNEYHRLLGNANRPNISCFTDWEI